jgi:hypothetical protein
MLALLKQFKTWHKEDGFILGSWLGTQRDLKIQGQLDPDRQKRFWEMASDGSKAFKCGSIESFEVS